MLTHTGTQEIKTDRIILRKVTRNDVNDIFTNYATDTEVTRFLSFAPHKDIAETLNIVESWIKNYEDLKFYHWAIEFNNEVIGGISAVEFDELNCSYELGYCIGRKFWGQGIMTEVAHAVIQYLFTEVNMHRITAKHDVKNPASGKVMQYNGMRYEGIYKGHYLRRDGDISDAVVYAILRDEWLRRV